MESAGLVAVERWWGPMFAGWYAVAAVPNALGGFCLVAAMFALIYKVMPRVHVHWKDVWIGAVFTAMVGVNYLDRSATTILAGGSGE